MGAALPLRETHRLISLAGEALAEDGRPAKRRRVRKNIEAVAHTRATGSPGIARLVRFLKLLRRFDAAPWAKDAFDVNERMMRRLVHSHLPIIVGREAYEREKAALGALVNSPDPCTNVVWVTNRQQGKTTTLAKFVAALVVLAPVNGSLVCIYSTNLSRSTEVLKLAKQYINFLGEDGPVIRINNDRSLEVLTKDGYVHTATARPRNPDSCRGDAPASAIFDEIAFVLPDFWHQFAFPLLQVRDRVFTCATTPPAFGSFFCDFIREVTNANAAGDYFFRLVNHGLVCPECEAAGTPQECAHRLHRLPPWKSIFKIKKMKALVPEHRREEFEQEVYGVLRTQTGSYLPAKLVMAMAERPPIAACTAHRTYPVYIGVDPPSHHSSRFGMCALLHGSRGEIIIIGLAECKALRSDALDIAAVVTAFIRLVRCHPWVQGRPIVPIIECNNNEVLAMSILAAFRMHPPVYVPFTRANFDKEISENLGVWTTEGNKQAMLALAFSAFLDGRVFVAPDAVSCRMTTVNGVAVKGDFTEALGVLCAQLAAFRDLPNGKISGKIGEHGADDLGMGFLMPLYWSMSCRALGV